MTESDITTLCVIGMGPRGLSVAERVAANASVTGQRVVLHVVDPYLGAGGRVWRSTQSPVLLMNTVASQVTMFTDGSVQCDGPIRPGPSLHEWAGLVTLMESVDRYPEAVRDEARRLGPDSYPTRAFYGHYLQWVLDHVVRTAPAHVSVHLHADTAVALDDAPDGTQSVTLADGQRLTGIDSVVLTLGHVDMALSGSEEELVAYTEAQRVTYLRTANPAEVDLDVITPGQRVALRGMGLNFFDYMALLTVGRGGRFVPGDDGLTYQPSGNEPLMFVGSRRGVPYHSRGENQKGAFGRHMPLFLTVEVIGELRDRHEGGDPVEFVADVWPLVDREVRAVYYHALIAARDGQEAADSFLWEFCQWQTTTPSVDEKLLRHSGVPESDWWNWDRVARPYGDQEFRSNQEFQDWLLGYLRQDVVEARLGNVRGPMKAALDVMRDLRNEIRLVVDHAGITGGSYRSELQSWYTPLNAFVSIGPPPSRIEELIALIEAGVVNVIGPGLTVTPTRHGTGLVVSSSQIPDSTVEVSALIEARLPEVDIRSTEDRLLRSLVARGQCRPYRIPDPERGEYQTGAMAVTRRPCRLIDRSGRIHPNRYALSIPTETVHWATAAGIRPGVDSVILGDADAIARACLAIPAVPQAPSTMSTPVAS
ncbi:FAD/NAD(P)-binding protein [Micromonospora sp. WMMD734]|uniref:FAD/NAD(P)-binding protein n=1 Tax=Micromonospora sp. WMMD734 TaxID=3404129 RepID=UPI003B9502CA